MTIARRDPGRLGYRGRPDAEVVAALVNDGSAVRVARAAVGEALRLGTTVRFIQVLPAAANGEDLAEADSATFRAALRALRGHPRTRSTFELTQGEAKRILVERSQGAAVLVVGEDRSTPLASVAAHCRRHASCAVHTVVLGD